MITTGLVYFPARIALLAAAVMHEEGTFSVLSKGHKNNNPGNIRKWGDLPIVDGFAQFPTFLDGFTALCQDIYDNQNLTITQFIQKYAPSTENNTQSYIREVCLVTGFKPEEDLA